MIVRLDGTNRKFAEAVYDLHCLLGSSITKLGRSFAVDFYYGLLVREGIVGCNVYVHEGKVVGFSAYADDSNSIFRRGVSRGPFKLAMSLVRGFMTDISVAKTTWSILRQFSIMDKEPAYDIPAEMLSMVVLEEFRSPRFVKETGLRITNDLFEATMNHLESLGVPGIKMFVDRGNILAHVLYLRYGFKVEGECRQRGRDSLVYVKRFDRAPSAKQD